MKFSIFRKICLISFCFITCLQSAQCFFFADLFRSLIKPWCPAQSIEMPTCPPLVPMANFEIEKFYGKWYMRITAFVFEIPTDIVKCTLHNHVKLTNNKLVQVQSFLV